MAMVCSCHAVSERKVARAVDQGARCIEDVGSSCRAGSSCGTCHETIERIIAGRLGNSVPSSTRVSVGVA